MRQYRNYRVFYRHFDVFPVIHFLVIYFKSQKHNFSILFAISTYVKIKRNISVMLKFKDSLLQLI